MKLTGKARQKFEKWCCDRINLLTNQYDFRITKWNKNLMFYNHYWGKLPESMQFGVYVDFADSVGIYIEIMPYEGKSYYWLINDNEMYSGDTKTRPEARTEAIEKFNEIYNKR